MDGSNRGVGSPWASMYLTWVLVCLLVSPFFVFPLVKGAGLYDNQRLIQLSCALFALLVAAGRSLRGTANTFLWDRRIACLLGLFFLLGLTSTALAYSERHAFLEWVNLLSMLVMGWVVASEVSTRGEALLDRLLLAAGLSCVAYLLLEILVYISWLKAGVQPSPRQLIVGYNNYRFFNHVQTISLPLLGLLAARMFGRDRKLFWWGITALWWMLLFVGLGRGTLVGVAVGVAATWLLLRQTAARWCRTMLWSAVAGFAAYLLLYALVPVLLGMEPFGLFFAGAERSVENPMSGRRELWARAMEMMAAAPWLGAGPGHFAHYGLGLPSGNAHPHNWVLQIGSEWGIPALLALIGVIGLVVRRLWQMRGAISPKDGDTLTAWLVTCLAILVDGLVSGLLVTPTSLLWIGFYIGCAWGWVVSGASRVEKMSPIRLSIPKRSVGLAIMLALGYGLLGTVYPDVQGLGARQPLQQENFVYRPRFWQDGRF